MPLHTGLRHCDGLHEYKWNGSDTMMPQRVVICGARSCWVKFEKDNSKDLIIFKSNQ